MFQEVLYTLGKYLSNNISGRKAHSGDSYFPDNAGKTHSVWGRVGL